MGNCRNIIELLQGVVVAGFIYVVVVVAFAGFVFVRVVVSHRDSKLVLQVSFYGDSFVVNYALLFRCVRGTLVRLSTPLLYAACSGAEMRRHAFEE